MCGKLGLQNLRITYPSFEIFLPTSSKNTFYELLNTDCKVSNPFGFAAHSKGSANALSPE